MGGREETNLCHVSWRIGVLRTKHRSNAIDSLPTARNLKLLVELRRLS